MRRHLSLAGLILFPLVLSAEPTSDSLIISPEKFDFGWCPDNAKINAEFSVKNTGGELVPLTQVMPACGCTATDFTPSDLASNNETKVNLTFNTRGYSNVNFTKSATIQAGTPVQDHVVYLTGNVTDAAAKVFPLGDGILSFTP